MRNFRLFADQYEGNSEPNFAEYAHAGHVLYMHKATEGVGHVDAKHLERCRRAHEQGLTIVHYHFCRPDQHDLLREARQFWNVSRLAWQPGDYLTFDFEPEQGHDPRYWTQAYLADLWNAVHNASGEQARVYGSQAFLGEKLQEGWLRKRAVHAADYTRDPGLGNWGRRWWAWQGSDGLQGPLPHSLTGIGACDVNALNLRSALTLAIRARRRRWRGHH